MSRPHVVRVDADQHHLVPPSVWWEAVAGHS